MNGIECAKKIQDINPRVIIIFATGYEEYMPEAFELYAFDYIQNLLISSGLTRH